MCRGELERFSSARPSDTGGERFFQGRMKQARKCRRRGNKLFKEEKHNDSIFWYSRAIDLSGDKPSWKIYANRGKAYILVKEYASAMEDARKCMELRPDAPQGYLTLGDVLKVLKRFHDAIDTIRQGLAACPCDCPSYDQLKERLACFQLDEYYQLEVTRRTVESLSESTKKRSKEAKSPEMFVKLAKQCIDVHKKYLELQQSMIDRVVNMDDDTKLFICFNGVDSDETGRVHVRDLRKLMKAMATFQLSRTEFDLIFDEATKKVESESGRGDGTMDFNGFQRCVELTAEGLIGASPHDDKKFKIIGERTEFTIISDILSKSGIKQLENLGEDVMNCVNGNEDNAKKSTQCPQLKDNRMMALFDFFDIDGDGETDFREVAIGLYKITDDDMAEAAFGAIEMLLAIEKNDRRQLNFRQFSQLIYNVCSAAHKDFDEVADNFILSVLSPTHLTAEELDQLIIAESVFKEEACSTDDSEVAAKHYKMRQTYESAPHVGKIRRLFGLFDLNNDGSVDYEEFIKSINKYKEKLGIDEKKHVSVMGDLLEEDEELDTNSFTQVLLGYANEMGVDKHDFIDFLCVDCVSDDHSSDVCLDMAASAYQSGRSYNKSFNSSDWDNDVL